MKVAEIVCEAKISIRDQILADVRKHGGSLDDYFVRFTDVDKLGYSAKQVFGRTYDVGDPEFHPDYIGAGEGRPALWFYPLRYFLKSKDAYATDKPYVWLVKIRDSAWLQPVKQNTTIKQAAPAGKERVGMLKTMGVPAAVFFRPAFDLVGKYHDYKLTHIAHGQVLGRPKKSIWSKLKSVVTKGK